MFQRLVTKYSYSNNHRIWMRKPIRCAKKHIRETNAKPELGWQEFSIQSCARFARALDRKRYKHLHLFSYRYDIDACGRDGECKTQYWQPIQTAQVRTPDRNSSDGGSST